VGRNTKRIAELTGLSQSTINKQCEPPNYKDQNNSGRGNYAERTVQIMTAAIEAGQPRTAALAPLFWQGIRMDCAVIPLGQKHGSQIDLLESVSAFMKEGGEFVTASAEGLCDRRVEPKEYERMEREGHDAIRIILQTLILAKEAVE
jgi:hypothetical protein